MRSYFIKFSQSSAVYINYSLEYAIQDLHNLGYDGIDMWGGRPHIYKQDLDKHINEIINLVNMLIMKVYNFNLRSIDIPRFYVHQIRLYEKKVLII